MLGHKEFAPKLFYCFSLEAQVPEDHLLRRVAAVVDFAFVRRLTARFYSHTGRPGLDPVVLFKLALLGWLYGITSERRLAAEVRLHLAYRWFLGYDLDEATPDHSVLSKARARFGVTVYQAFFTEIVRQCEQAGHVRGDRLYVDSTLTAANASLDSMGARALVAQLPGLAGVDDHLAAVWRDNPGEPPDETPPALPPAAVEGSGGPRALRPSDPPNAPLGRLNERLVSRTDPDAALVARDKVPPGLYYKVHVGVDGGAARVVTAVEVTSGEVGDEQLLGRLLREHVGSTGRTVTEVVADTKYGTQANYLLLEAARIRPSIPPFLGGGVRRALGREHFIYDPATDRYRCPAGQPLRRMGRTRTGTPLGGFQYRADPQACRACPLKADCCGTAAARTITRPDDAGLSERVRAYLATRQARRSLRRRGCWVETVNAELKERHGLRRAQCRGRAKVQMQAYGAAIAYNVKKLAAGLRRRPGGAAEALLLCPSHRGRGHRLIPPRPRPLHPSTLRQQALHGSVKSRPAGRHRVAAE
jgi:transposase